jgi:hypothetical protein
MRFAIALLFLVHGIAHFAGFAVPWQLAETPTTHYGTKILNQRIDLGERGIRVYGLLWLLLALAFAGLAMAVLLKSPFWFRGTVVLASISTVFCLLSLPHTRVGLWLNIIMLCGLYVGNTRGWFTSVIS